MKDYDDTNPLIEHAHRELKAAGYSPHDSENDDSMDTDIYWATIRMVRAFASVGHSGGSAELHAQMIERLLRYKPLGPITDDPAEWMDHGEGALGTPGEHVWQNKRSSDCFSADGGETYWSVDEFRTGWRARIFGRRRMHTSHGSRHSNFRIEGVAE